MRHHYVPKHYLKGFTENADGKRVWVYPLGSDEPFAAGLDRVANETGFYTQDVESFLSEEVENPAIQVIDKLRAREEINSEEKLRLATYMAVMLKRVPKHRERVAQRVPSVSKSVFGEVDRQLSAIAESHPLKAAHIARLRRETEDIRKRYESQLPDNLWQEMTRPTISQQIVDVLSSMIWRFFISTGTSGFLTSDNPVFFFEQFGMNRPESEVSFPISTELTLWATWGRNVPVGFLEAKEQFVKEINRRTASLASRYLYHARKTDWVVTLANKQRHHLNRMV